MKKDLINLSIILCGVLCFIGFIWVNLADGAELATPVVISNNETAIKLDEKRIKITKITEREVEKRFLLDEKANYEDQISHCQKQIAEIDKLLSVWK
ncbi:MAG: hypothetical protein ACTSXA_00710 [Candidatus Heimdallarchaeota archaeon]